MRADSVLYLNQSIFWENIMSIDMFWKHKVFQIISGNELRIIVSPSLNMYLGGILWFRYYMLQISKKIIITSQVVCALINPTVIKECAPKVSGHKTNNLKNHRLLFTVTCITSSVRRSSSQFDQNDRLGNFEQLVDTFVCMDDGAI